jgi:antitoxin VapB
MPSPIQIKRPDVASDIRTLAALTGASITDAIAKAVSAQLAIERVKADAKLLKRRKEAEDTLAELRRLPVTGPIVSDDDLYDDDGLPK